MRPFTIIGLIVLLLLQTIVLGGFLSSHSHLSSLSFPQTDALTTHNCTPGEHHPGLGELDTCPFCSRSHVVVFLPNSADQLPVAGSELFLQSGTSLHDSPGCLPPNYHRGPPNLSCGQA